MASVALATPQPRLIECGDVVEPRGDGEQSDGQYDDRNEQYPQHPGDAGPASWSVLVLSAIGLGTLNRPR